MTIHANYYVLRDTRGLDVPDRGAWIRRALGHNLTWRAEAELPDVLGTADIMSDPAAAALVVKRRAMEGRMHGRPRSFLYPKPSGIGHRHLLSLDPYTDLELRRLVAPAVPTIECALKSEVIHSRFETPSDRQWLTTSWREARRTRDAEVERGRFIWPNGVEGSFDIESFYPTVSLERLTATLSSAGCPDGVIWPIEEALLGMSRIPGVPRGLPIGPEASAPLGMVALAGLDRVLRRSGVHFVRWVDDVTFWVPDLDSFWEVIEQVEDWLQLGGQRLNPSKTKFLQLAVGKPTIPALEPWLSGVADGDDPSGVVDEGSVSALMDDALDGLPQWLGQLGHAENPSAIRPLLERPEVINRFPKQCGRYLRRVSGQVPWGEVAEEIASEPTTPENAAGQLHLALVLPARSASASHSEQFFDKAQRLDGHNFAPLRDQLYFNCSRSAESTKARHRRSLETIDMTADLNTRRALLAAFRRGGVAIVAAREMRRQAKMDPDIAPTVEWALGS